MTTQGSGLLLAVDLGLRCGLACFGADGRLRWYRSTHFGSIGQLKRALPRLFAESPGVVRVVVEGDRQLGDHWQAAAERVGATVIRCPPETWRQRLLISRHRRTGQDAKRWADHLARAVIDWSGVGRPTSLRHDAAEAILIGLWGVLDAGWLTRLPAELPRG